MDDAELDLINKEQVVNNQKDISINELYMSLKEFSTSISSDSRMHFWKRDKIQNEYKWTSNPEELSKQLLIQFMNAKFGKENIPTECPKTDNKQGSQIIKRIIRYILINWNQTNQNQKRTYNPT